MLLFKHCKYSKYFFISRQLHEIKPHYYDKKVVFAIYCLRFNKSYKDLKSFRNMMPIPWVVRALLIE